MGDVGMCADSQLTDLCSKLNGNIIVLCGNHDKSIGRLEKVGFKVFY